MDYRICPNCKDLMDDQHNVVKEIPNGEVWQCYNCGKKWDHIETFTEHIGD